MRVGAVVLIVGIAASYVAVTVAIWPPVPLFALNDTVAVRAKHDADTVAAPTAPVVVNVAVVSLPPDLLYPVLHVTAQDTRFPEIVIVAEPWVTLQLAALYWAYIVVSAVNVLLPALIAPEFVMYWVPPVAAE